jgi:hypothetical protein
VVQYSCFACLKLRRMLTATRAGRHQSLVLPAKTDHGLNANAEERFDGFCVVSASFRGRNGGRRWVERDDTKKAESTKAARGFNERSRERFEMSRTATKR